MKLEIDFSWRIWWACDIRTAWESIKRFKFKKALQRLFWVECPISPKHKGIFIEFFGVGIYVRTN